MDPTPSLRACGARPSAWDANQRETALGGMMGKKAKAVFLGGAHSVRPHSRALRKPSHLLTDPQDRVAQMVRASEKGGLTGMAF